ncbi:DUF134 domain-containing protein [Proteiniclasticum sp. C24MP]|uniref:DUF134 domain-containing protein n=1 Tax=Proteiniclasticum sp. C24MP TaxID=3374101 RepID=UPI0037546CF9
MPRPVKWRKVCCMPEYNRFGPKGVRNPDADIIEMTVDEYETIRLMDQEGMTQEECASAMGVARTTVQSIYVSARRKIAQVLVFGLDLHIQGGEIRLSDDENRMCSCRRDSDDCVGGRRKGVQREKMEND